MKEENTGGTGNTMVIENPELFAKCIMSKEETIKEAKKFVTELKRKWNEDFEKEYKLKEKGKWIEEDF